MKNLILINWLYFLSHLAFGQGGTKEVIICNGTNVRLKASSVGAYGYEWRKDLQVIPGFSGDELLISEEGNYAAVALNAEGCVSNQSVVIILEFRKPVAVNDFFSGKRNSTILVNALQNDQTTCAEFDPATLKLESTPAHGSVTIQNGIFQYVPEVDFDKIDTFRYSVSDKNGQSSNTASVEVNLSTPLPVTLISFEAVKKESTSLLTWTTTSETNSEKFVIQRSTDAKTWIDIGSLATSGGEFLKRGYDFTDSLPESGVNYYRLKMVDLDASFAFSQIKSVNFPEFSWAKLYPNPVSHILHISIRNSKVRKMRLINLSGQVVYNAAVRLKEIDLDMHGYARGIYFIHLEQENGLVSIFKIMHD